MRDYCLTMPARTFCILRFLSLSVCSVIFVLVSLMTDPPAREKIAGLTWSLSGEAVSGVDVMALPMLAERPWWRKINILMSVLRY